VHWARRAVKKANFCTRTADAGANYHVIRCGGRGVNASEKFSYRPTDELADETHRT